jgi:hypothetical protein
MQMAYSRCQDKERAKVGKQNSLDDGENDGEWSHDDHVEGKGEELDRSKVLAVHLTGKTAKTEGLENKSAFFRFFFGM